MIAPGLNLRPKEGQEEELNVMVRYGVRLHNPTRQQTICSYKLFGM